MKRGDAVRFKNGHSPTMTVVGDSPTEVGAVICVWFGPDCAVHFQPFFADMLEVAASGAEIPNYRC